MDDAVFEGGMGKQRREVLLFWDNATSHPTDLLLKNIKLIFLPPNTTSCCQPLDQGIIQNFKVRYRRLVIARILAEIEKISSAEELTKKITVLDAVMWIHTAVSDIAGTCVLNCFGKCGFSVSYEEEASKNESDTDLISNEDLIEHLPPYLYLATEEESDDISLFIPSNNEEEESDDDDECIIDEPTVSPSEAKDCITKLNTFVTQTNDIELLQLFKKLQIKFENDALVTKLNSAKQRSPLFSIVFQITALLRVIH